MNTLLRNIAGPLLAATALYISLPTAAVSPEPPAATKDCLELRDIREVEVLNNQQLLFRTGIKKAYLSDLPRRCPGLSKNSPIMYKTSLSKLCKQDMITVLQSVGSGYQPGSTCGLGVFTAVTETEVKALKDARKKTQP